MHQHLLAVLDNYHNKDQTPHYSWSSEGAIQSKLDDLFSDPSANDSLEAKLANNIGYKMSSGRSDAEALGDVFKEFIQYGWAETFSRYVFPKYVVFTLPTELAADGVVTAVNTAIAGEVRALKIGDFKFAKVTHSSELTVQGDGNKNEGVKPAP